DWKDSVSGGTAGSPFSASAAAAGSRESATTRDRCGRWLRCVRSRRLGTPAASRASHNARMRRSACGSKYSSSEATTVAILRLAGGAPVRVARRDRAPADRRAAEQARLRGAAVHVDLAAVPVHARRASHGLGRVYTVDGVDAPALDAFAHERAEVVPDGF